MIPITTTLNTPKKMARLLWHPLGGTNRDGVNYLMGVCWWWIGLGRKKKSRIFPSTGLNYRHGTIPRKSNTLNSQKSG